MLRVACRVQGTFQSTVEVGDIVQLSTSGNWTINSTTAGTAVLMLGVVESLSDDSTRATVIFPRANGVMRHRVGATVSLGQMVEASGAHSDGVKGSTNTGISGYYLVCASTGDPSGYCEVLYC